MELEWRRVIGFDGYEVSNTGLVRSFKRKNPKILKYGIVKTHCKEYLRVALRIDNKSYHKYIHRLVAEAFLPNPENRPQVNHKDNNPNNNNKYNLEWATNSENQRHRFKSKDRPTYVYKDRNKYRVNVKHLNVSKQFYDLEKAKEYAKQFY